MTRIVRKYGRFGRFPVVEKWVLQYNIEPGTESLDVCKEYRRQGIGTQLMKDMLALLKKRGYERASLAVQKANYAVRMYEKGGFRTVDENDEEFIMACEL